MLTHSGKSSKLRALVLFLAFGGLGAILLGFIAGDAIAWLGAAMVALSWPAYLTQMEEPARSRVIKTILLWGFELCFVLLLLALTLWGYDRYLEHFGNSAKRPGLDVEKREKTIRTLELYPYEGWHVQADFHHTGPMPWEDSTGKNFDVKTGSMGFFVDFDLLNPPPKAADEFRIILTGGSGAQGWGATSNTNMLYSRLQKHLNERCSKFGVTVRVINLAMGASASYQNFIALNRWGHSLNPDLILTYSGRNDFVVSAISEPGTDAHYDFNKLDALTLACRASEVPENLSLVNRFYPNILNESSIGQAIKLTFCYDYYLGRAAESYRSSRNLKCINGREALNEVVEPQYIHSLQSIKRDFEGIPIMVAWQAIGKPEFLTYQSLFDKNFYDRMYEHVKSALEHYQNDRWYFVNIHSRVAGRTDGVYQTHLDDTAQEVVAQMLAEEIEPVIAKTRTELR